MARSRYLGPLLRVPLVAKLAGANLIVVAGVTGVAVAAGWRPAAASDWLVAEAFMVASVAVTVGLVSLALQPIRDLERTAQRVSQGDYAARVPLSPLADHAMVRVGETLNALLDRLTSDRTRMRELAAMVIRAGDRDRARTAAALHDSAAQSIAAISWQLSAMARETPDTGEHNPDWNHGLLRIQQIAEDVLEEVRLLAQDLHPRVLEDLGLSAALTQLAREASETSGVPVIARIDGDGEEYLDSTVATALYRVAQEAVANALFHGAPEQVTIRLSTGPTGCELVIEDDGSGFDTRQAEAQPGSGIFAMRQRTSLVNAEFGLMSSPGLGTVVRVAVASVLSGQDQAKEKSA